MRVQEGALCLNAAANSVAYAEMPLSQGMVAVSCTLRPEDDKGASWGPGLALVWASGKTFRVNVRAEARWGVYGYEGEILAPIWFPSQQYVVAIVLEEEQISVYSSPDGALWQTLAQVPRSVLPGDPIAVRVGKMGLPDLDQDYEIPGDPGHCSVTNVRLWGAAGSPPQFE